MKYSRVYKIMFDSENFVKLTDTKAILGLESRTLTARDLDKLISIFRINRDFFTDVPKKTIMQYADLMRKSVVSLEFKSVRDSHVSVDPFINSYIVANIDYMVKPEFKDGVYSALTAINGPDLWTGNEKGGVCHINLCWIDFDVKTRNGWMSKYKKVNVTIRYVYVYVSPMFITINKLYDA
jgi:hypothetical protein